LVGCYEVGSFCISKTSQSYFFQVTSNQVLLHIKQEICLLSSDGAFGDPESSLEIQEKITKPGYDKGFVQTSQNITELFSTIEDTLKVQKMDK
jgi:hypothetical protein